MNENNSSDQLSNSTERIQYLKELASSNEDIDLIIAENLEIQRDKELQEFENDPDTYIANSNNGWQDVPLKVFLAVMVPTYVRVRIITSLMCDGCFTFSIVPDKSKSNPTNWTTRFYCSLSSVQQEMYAELQEHLTPNLKIQNITLTSTGKTLFRWQTSSIKILHDTVLPFLYEVTEANPTGTTPSLYSMKNMELELWANALKLSIEGVNTKAKMETMISYRDQLTSIRRTQTKWSNKDIFEGKTNQTAADIKHNKGSCKAFREAL